ncbi:MAG TPA: dethiobiotin synthase [Rhizomicrobium sp.]
MSGYFITGTGTDIGKTFVTAGLIRHLRAEGKRVTALKPVISGFDDPAQSDSGILLTALGEAVTKAALDRISPWRFAAPLSPDMAASREGREIDFAALVEYCRAPHDDTLLIEGVGGVMVPLDASHTVLDWMVALKLPVILVAGTYLGSLSHTLTAARTLEQARLTIAALVVNESEESAVPMDESIMVLRRFLPTLPFFEISHHKPDFAPLAGLLS